MDRIEDEGYWAEWGHTTYLRQRWLTCCDAEVIIKMWTLNSIEKIVQKYFTTKSLVTVFSESS